MRSRLLAGAVALALAVGGLLLPASPASATCGGHDTHPDLYHSGGIFWGDGTAIRRGPHRRCAALGRGFPGEGIDVHCAILNEDGRLWLFVRDLDDGTRGWSRVDALRIPNPVLIDDCFNRTQSLTVSG